MRAINRKRVLIIGHGEMGRAFEDLLMEDHDLRVWECTPDRSTPPAELASWARESEFFFFCVPANSIRALLAHLHACMSDRSICIGISKGLDDGGNLPATIFMAVCDGHRQYGIMYGPMISEEVLAGKPAFAQLGCETTAAFDATVSLFHPRKLYLEYCNDVIGMSWCAVLKNAYAILLGGAEELRLGDNMRGYLVVKSIEELVRIIGGLGGESTTAYGLSGLGDLVTTGTSKGSHHYELGRKLARGDRSSIGGEAAHALTVIEKHRLFELTHYPLIRLVKAMLSHPVDLEQSLRALIEH